MLWLCLQHDIEYLSTLIKKDFFQMDFQIFEMVLRITENSITVSQIVFTDEMISFQLPDE